MHTQIHMITCSSNIEWIKDYESYFKINEKEKKFSDKNKRIDRQKVIGMEIEKI